MAFIYQFQAITVNTPFESLDGLHYEDTPLVTEAQYEGLRASAAANLEVRPEEVIIQHLSFLHEVKNTPVPFEVQ